MDGSFELHLQRRGLFSSDVVAYDGPWPTWTVRSPPLAATAQAMIDRHGQGERPPMMEKEVDFEGRYPLRPVG